MEAKGAFVCVGLGAVAIAAAVTLAEWKIDAAVTPPNVEPRSFRLVKLLKLLPPANPSRRLAFPSGIKMNFEK